MAQPSHTIRDQAEYEAHVHDHAVIWTAFVQLAPGNRQRHDFTSKEEAIAAAKLGVASLRRPIMIYATDADRHDVMAGTVGLDGQFKSALRLR